MTTSTLGAFRYAGIAALPVCVALAVVTGMTSRELSATARDALATECIVGKTRHADVDPAPTTLDDVPFLGELTVTATRLGVAQPEVRSASDRSRPSRPQAKPARASYPSVL
jgi:hypothetical protein